MKIQKMISLDYETAEIAKRIPNLSAWIRDKLRSYRNQSENRDAKLANNARKIESTLKINSNELLFQLEQLSDDEIKALLAILRNAVQ